MTIVVSVKVHDGLVLASDSASTLTERLASGEEKTLNVWNHQNKVFNLYKGLSIGGITFGHGAIGHSSISTLAKDFRALLCSGEGWRIEPAAYTMQDVAEKARRFIFEENFLPTYGDEPVKPGVLGFWVGGYSAGQALAELWDISIRNGECPAPQLLRAGPDAGLNWGGDPEAVTRIVHGHSETLPAALLSVGAPPEQLDAVMEVIRTHALVDLVWAPMPIQDAIDLAHFLVSTAIAFARFRPGAETIGGPIEIAAITKHEGFKWVKRKHYFGIELNRDSYPAFSNEEAHHGTAA